MNSHNDDSTTLTIHSVLSVLLR